VPVSHKLAQAEIPVQLTLFDSVNRFEEKVDEMIEKTVGEFKVTEVNMRHAKLLRQVFGMVRMDAVMIRRPVVMVSEHTPVAVGLARMTAEGVGALAITAKEGGKVVGVVTSQDVLFYTLDLLRGDQDRVDALYTEEHMSQLMGRSGRDHWRPVAGADSLLKALLTLSGEAHRMCVVDERKKLAGFVSQIDLVRVFAEHPTLLGPRHDQLVMNLGLHRRRREIFAVGHDIPVWQAFDVIRKQNVSAVAVLDRSDHLQVGERERERGLGVVVCCFSVLLLLQCSNSVVRSPMRRDLSASMVVVS
jgi:CBS domain-containing protein